MTMFWNDLSRSLAWMEELRREMDQSATATFPEGFTSRFSRTFPTTRLYDAGPSLVLRADVPGLSQGDVKLTFHNDTLTLSGERKPDAPEGYTAHRQERGEVRFSRSFTLPVRIDAEKTGAVLKDGVLTVTLPKHPESQPREIAVKA